MKKGPFEDADVVFTYTDEQAIDDGVLVQPMPENRPGVLLTIGVHAACEKAAKRSGRSYAEVVVPLLQDAALIVQAGLEKDPDERLWCEGLEGNATGQTLWIGLNGLHGFTVMFPEDY